MRIKKWIGTLPSPSNDEICKKFRRKSWNGDLDNYACTENGERWVYKHYVDNENMITSVLTGENIDGEDWEQVEYDKPGALPALNKDAIGRRFRRGGWKKEGLYACTDDGLFWRYVSPNYSAPLCDDHKIAKDWVEVEDYEISESDFEFTISDLEKFDRALSAEDIEKIYNKKENKMENRIKEEAAKVFTDIEKRSKYTGELYGPDGKGKAILAFDKKSDAKKVLQLVENIGCYLVLRKEVAVLTTEIPVVKAAGV